MPPAWLGSLWHLLVLGDTSVPILIQGSLALLAPAFFLWLITRVLAGTFSQRLQALTEGRNDTPNLTGTDTVRAELGPWPRFWQGLLCASPPEAAAFALSWKMTARSRDYKLRVYPSLAFLPMMFFYFGVAQGEGSLAERWQEVQMGYHYLLLGYFSLFLVITPLTSTYFSDQYAAAWVFPASPVARPGELLAGTFSAIMVRFMLPGFLLLLLSAGLIWGPYALDDVLLAGLICVAMALIMMQVKRPGLPFAEPWANAQRGAHTTTNLLLTVLIGLLGLAHYLLADFQVLIRIGLVVAAVGVVILFRLYRRQGWEGMGVD